MTTVAKKERDQEMMKKARRWAFTWNNYTDENVNSLKAMTADKCDYLIFGFEKAPETGTPHLQGYIEFSNPVQGYTAKKRIDPINGLKSNVSLASANKVREANIKYCTKSETKDPEACTKYESEYIEVVHKLKKQGERTDWHRMHEFIKDEPDFGKFAEAFPEAAIKHHAGIDRLIRSIKEQHQKAEFIEQFDNIELRPWQQRLVDELQKPANDRKIIWIYDEKGNQGKSWLGRYLVAKHNAARFENAASKDIALAYEGEPIVIFDFSRSTEDRLNYQIIESIKNGILFSPKYNSTTKYFKSPHIVCMANWGPKVSAMSADRWDIRDLNSNDELKSDNIEIMTDNIIAEAEAPAESTSTVILSPVVPHWVVDETLEDNIAEPTEDMIIEFLLDEYSMYTWSNPEESNTVGLPSPGLTPVSPRQARVGEPLEQ